LGSDPLEINLHQGRNCHKRNTFAKAGRTVLPKNFERLNLCIKQLTQNKISFFCHRCIIIIVHNTFHMLHYSSRPGSKYFNSVNLQNEERFHGQLPDDHRFQVLWTNSICSGTLWLHNVCPSHNDCFSNHQYPDDDDVGHGSVL